MKFWLQAAGITAGITVVVLAIAVATALTDGVAFGVLIIALLMVVGTVGLHDNLVARAREKNKDKP